MTVLNSMMAAYRAHGVRGVTTLARYYGSYVTGVATGPGRECPVCGWHGREFRPFSVPQYGIVRPRASCPSCGALERHRAYAPFYRAFFAEHFAGRRPDVLHFAPDESLAPVLRPLAGRYDRSNYENPAPGELQLDLHELALPDASYDVLIMNHVLCCLPDDGRAARSMHRVLRPGGVVLAGEHILAGQPTRESDRPGYGGIRRAYGAQDLAARFAPLEVEVVDVTRNVPATERGRARLSAPEYVIVLHKPAERGEVGTA